MMTRNEIIEKLQNIISFAMPDKAEMLNNSNQEANLHTDLGLNSVGLLYVIIAIEEFFNVSFDNVCFNDFQTVKDVIDFIEEKQK
ncbi:MAG: hypothetical protein IKA31_00970 [Clostridia bacterium]|nr:hypothetical protein [Clostridia bacterium]